jgi:hypothetical protein
VSFELSHVALKPPASAGLHPEGEPIRDKGHQALIERFRKIVSAEFSVRAEVPLWVLRDTMGQFPSFAEAMGSALRMLPDAIGTMREHAAHPMIEETVMVAR